MGTFSNDVIAVQQWWMKELKTLTRKVLDAEEKRQRKAREESEKGLGDYQTYNDIQDAYGMGMITERKRDKLMELLEKREQAAWTDRQYEMKIDLLQELYAMAQRAIEDHKKGEKEDEQT